MSLLLSLLVKKLPQMVMMISISLIHITRDGPIMRFGMKKKY